MSYERLSPTGQSVVWDPDDPQVAAEAIANVDGTGVADPANVPDEAPIDVEPGLAESIREEYAAIKGL